MKDSRWRRFTKDLEEKRQLESEIERGEWRPTISDIDHIHRTVWKIQPNDEYYEEFYQMYDQFGCRDYDESIGLYIEEDKELCNMEDPSNPYRYARNLAYERMGDNLFKPPQEQNLDFDEGFDDVKL